MRPLNADASAESTRVDTNARTEGKRSANRARMGTAMMKTSRAASTRRAILSTRRHPRVARRGARSWSISEGLANAERYRGRDAQDGGRFALVRRVLGSLQAGNTITGVEAHGADWRVVAEADTGAQVRTI